MRGSWLCLLMVGWLGLPLALTGQVADPKQADAKQIEADEQKLKAADLKTDGPALLEFLKSRTLTEDERERVELLIAKLGASSFKVREQASHDLIAKGPAVLALLRQGLSYPDDLEVQRRCEVCIQKIKERDRWGDMSGAVVRLIGVRKPAAAVEVLVAHAPWLDDEAVLDDIREVLPKLVIHDGKLDKALVAGLTDKSPVRRATAGEAVVVAGAASKHKKAIAALLADPQFTVRWRVATALVFAGDREAMPLLIDQLADATQDQAWQIEDILCRLAEGKLPPSVSLGSDGASRKKCRDAWQKWWKDNGGAVNLAVLKDGRRLLGCTTMVLLDLGRIIEVDGRNNLRWQIDDLQYPLDVQVLDKGRVLVAEYYGNRITERNFKGQILWQTDFAEPQMAQRMADGNTFMASRFQMLEIDRNGKKVFTYNASRNVGIMKCMKLADGQIACLFDDGSYVRMDATSKVLATFRLDLGDPLRRLYGGRLHALPSGNVLIPFHFNNKVVEYDSQGKAVWQVKVDQPVAATRLANGNTLVTSMAQNRAVEFDPKGNEVWEHREESRVTRAVRR